MFTRNISPESADPMIKRFDTHNILFTKKRITKQVKAVPVDSGFWNTTAFLFDNNSFLLSLLDLGDFLDDTDGNSLTHVTDGKSSKRRVVGESLDAKGLGGLQVDNAGISSLDKLGVFLEHLTGTAVHLLLDQGEFACNVGSVAIQHGRVSVGDLSRVVHDNDLGVEAGNSGGGIVLGVTADVSTAKILDGNVLHVETNIVSWDCLGKRLVVHLDGLNFGNDTRGGEKGVDTGLDDTSFDTADGHSSNTSNLVDILEGKTKGLVGRALGGLDIVKSLEQVGSLVPRHVGRFVNHVVSLPSRDRNERNLHGLVSDLLEVVEDFSLDFVVTVLRVLDSLVVHLVHGNNHLLDSKSVGKKGVLTGLSILGDTSLESSLGRVNDKDGNIGLGSSGNHVLDEITVSRGINDGELVLGRLELPEGNVDGDTTFTLGLEVIEHPGILEGSLSEFGGFLLELFDGTLIDTSALVNQVTGGGGLT
jgi:hypothetical protein